jgi:hypothetical protein
MKWISGVSINVHPEICGVLIDERGGLCQGRPRQAAQLGRPDETSVVAINAAPSSVHRLQNHQRPPRTP